MGKVLVQLNLRKLEAEVYESVIRDLNDGRNGNRPKRLHHVVVPNGNSMHVADIWESEEAFSKFGETMVARLTKNGNTPDEPIILSVQDIVIPEKLNG